MLQQIRRRIKAIRFVTERNIKEAIADGIHDTLKLRIRNEGNDVNWPKDKPSTKASKARRGLDLRTGVATGELLRDLDEVKVVVE